MPEPAVRLHLVAPPSPGTDIALCFAAACETGDVASLLAGSDLVPNLRDLARQFDVALITVDPQAALNLGCDGVETSSREDYDKARAVLGFSHIVGAHCGSSRHLAMEHADAGADYIAFSQGHDQHDAGPIIAWWSELF